MTDRELESRLAAALERTAPDDVEAVLARCGAQTGAVVPLTGQGSGQSGRQKKRWVPLAVAACLVLAVAGGGAGYVHQLNQAVASVVCLDVNPSVELTVNRHETVLSATPANADAVAILDGMDLTGAKVDVAMNAIVGSMLTNGYVDELANSILITVEDDDAQRGAALQQALTAQADAILASYQVNGAILSQTIQNSTQLQQLAADYGISSGKAALIQTIVDGSHGTKTFESLVGLSINELNLLYSALNTAAPPLTGGRRSRPPRSRPPARPTTAPISAWRPPSRPPWPTPACPPPTPPFWRRSTTGTTAGWCTRWSSGPAAWSMSTRSTPSPERWSSMSGRAAR